MDNPNQYLVHLTSRGPKVYGQDGAAGKFKCVTTQPLKDINKFGLLHYSIPKQMDPLTSANNQFTLRLKFSEEDANGRVYLDVPVTIPELDYNSVVVAGDVDHTFIDGDFHSNQNRAKASAARFGAPSRNKMMLAFDEILQCSINWALMEAFDQHDGGGVNPQGTIAMQCLARIGCIVNYDPKEGRYMFQIGYRGYNALQNDADPAARAYAAGTMANSGEPWPVMAVPAVGIAASATGQYTFRSAAGTLRANNDPCLVGGNYNQGAIDQASLVGFEFRNLSMRLQLMMGAGAADLGQTVEYPPNQIFTRGRVRLVNYTNANGIPQESGLFGLGMTIAPNLDAPSMLYLQLTVPGTKTKILGQADERGGWAIPTPSNAYVSTWDNAPTGTRYTVGQSRFMPYVDAQAQLPAPAFTNALYLTYQTNAPAAAPAALAAADAARRKLMGRDGLGYNFDPIPHAGDTPNPAVNNLCPVNDFGPQTCTMIKFKNKSDFHKRARVSHRTTLGGLPCAGFGAGMTRINPVFTTSMIEPNWIYTQTSDSTIQTFDVELLWGDTSEPIHTSNGHPVQLSIIASS